MPRFRFARVAARALMIAGLAAGILGVLMWTFGVRISVPEWMWRVAAVKLTLAAAIGLVATGALLLRHLKRSERMDALVDGALPGASPRALGAARWERPTQERTRERARLTTPPETPVP